MNIAEADNREEWGSFLEKQVSSPFLQSWTMGDVYAKIGQESVRFVVRDKGHIEAVCQSIVVPARRGRHMVVQYGPVIDQKAEHKQEIFTALLSHLKQAAKQYGCSFIRMSPFWSVDDPLLTVLKEDSAKTSPMHLLAEHLFYIPLVEPNPWEAFSQNEEYELRKDETRYLNRGKEEILMGLRKTTRNLVRRAEREGVEIEVSTNPERDMKHFITLHEETRKRHHFTPYTNAFFKAQLLLFSDRNQASLYLAKYQGDILAASIHMHYGGETSYHHGASTHRYPKIPASYLLQWTAIEHALDRGDNIYNFWGIAPEGARKHPFLGVTTFKTGFGGLRGEVTHCVDIPLNMQYYGTRAFEFFRRWQRGFG